MVLHSGPEGFVYDDDNREGIIFTGSKSGSTIALSFAAYLKTSTGEESSRCTSSRGWKNFARSLLNSGPRTF